jgi:hypothetical protein
MTSVLLFCLKDKHIFTFHLIIILDLKQEYDTGILG